jgi:hypothetical protein
MSKTLWDAATGKQVVPKTYYDSQSGITITIPDGVFIHAQIPPEFAGDRQQATELLAASAPFSIHLADGDSVAASLGVLIGTPATAGGVIDPGAPAGRVVCVDVTCSGPGAGPARADWAAAKAAIRAAKAAGFSARCNLMDSFSHAEHGQTDVNVLQLASAYFADEGCDLIVLVNDPAKMLEVDDYDLQEAVEACLWNDIAGMPMSVRLGVRTAGSAAGAGAGVWEMQVRAALEMKVINFDACLGGVQAPAVGALAQLLEAEGQQHGTSAAAAAEAEAFVR